MADSGNISETQFEELRTSQVKTASRHCIQNFVWNAVYVLAVAVSLSLWFTAIRAPLWLDESGSFWQIAAGFSGIMSRQGLSFPAYSFILWFWARLAGTSEIALRIPSILAMLGAVYMLYRAGRELFERDVAVIAAIVFSLHPIVIFASIDVRPYAFGALAINSTVLALVRLRQSNSDWLAALFGLLAACTIYFHFLFATILPALVVCFFTLKFGDRKTLWRQFAFALAAFALAFLPAIPGLQFMFQTRGTHVFEEAPKLVDLVWTLAPGCLPFVLGGTCLGAVVVAALKMRLDFQGQMEGWKILICVVLALVPILILYGVSAATPIHVFVPRYRLVAIPGIALCWALILRQFKRPIRLLFCVAVVATTAYLHYSSPISAQHGYTWKYAFEFVQHNAAADQAPVLICSDFPEADYVAMPLGPAKDSALFAPLAYYKLSVPVVPLPRALNAEAIRVGSQFLQEAARQHQRFLALAFIPSYSTLQWLAQSASGTHFVRKLGVFDGIEVLEFVPRIQAEALR